MASDCMSVEFFDTLKRRDFDNGAITDDLRRALKHRDALLNEIEVLRELAEAVEEWSKHSPTQQTTPSPMRKRWSRIDAAYNAWRELKEGEGW